MQMPLRSAAVFIVVMLLGIGASAQQPAHAPTVVAATRGDAYSNPNTKIEARDKAADVVLMIRVGGLSHDEFRKIARDDIYILAGEEKLPPNVLAFGVVKGKDEMLLVVVGPRGMRGMSLVMGNYRPVRFTADETIASELR
jgi:hypothetical protein